MLQDDLVGQAELVFQDDLACQDDLVCQDEHVFPDDLVCPDELGSQDELVFEDDLVFQDELVCEDVLVCLSELVRAAPSEAALGLNANADELRLALLGPQASADEQVLRHERGKIPEYFGDVPRDRLAKLGCLRRNRSTPRDGH